VFSSYVARNVNHILQCSQDVFGSFQGPSPPVSDLAPHCLYRALKRTKAYSTLEGVRPTLRNKPSGLRADWPNIVKPSTSRQRLSTTYTQSPSSSTSRSSSSSTSLLSPATPRSPPPELNSNHVSSLLAISPPPIFSNASSPPSFFGNVVPVIDAKARANREFELPITVRTSPSHCAQSETHLSQPFSLPRAFRDAQGRRRQPGVRDLPQWLRESFRNLYIHRIIEQVCLSDMPWNNPSLSSLQRELNYAYPTHRIRLHSDDAAVVPVSVDRCCHASCYLMNTRPFVTSESFETKLETKGSLPPSNTCQTSTIEGCWHQRMRERNTLRRSSLTPNVPSYGSIFVRGRYHLLVNVHTTMRSVN
jgi:hypothetical protein